MWTSVLCQMYPDLYAQLVDAKSKSRLAAWFRSRSDYYGWVARLGDEDGGFLEVEPLYDGFRLYVDSGPNNGMKLTWDQIFRHCRESIIDGTAWDGLPDLPGMTPGE